MTVLKYWDPNSASYKVLTGPPGPVGPANPYIVVTNLVTTPPDVNHPPVNPPTGLLVADTSVPDPVAGNFLPLSGGTLSGVLNMNAGWNYINGVGATPISETPSGGHATLRLNKNGAFSNSLQGSNNGLGRWNLVLGSGAAESGSNVGSDFSITRFNDAGTTVDSPLIITRSSGAVAIKGTSTNDSAAAGNVGEFISSIVTSPGVTLTTGTPATVTSISLTAGDWDVRGEVWIAVGAGNASFVAAGLYNTANIPPVPQANVARTSFGFTSAVLSGLQNLPLISSRLSLTAGATWSLTAMCTFPSGTTTAYGRIDARRMR